MYGYLIEMFCLSCYGLVEKYELHKSATIKPEVGIVLSGTILALPIIKDLKDGKQKPKEDTTQKPSGDPLKNKKETKNNNEVEVVEVKNNPNNIELNKNNAMPKNSIAGDIYND